MNRLSSFLFSLLLIFTSGVFFSLKEVPTFPKKHVLKVLTYNIRHASPPDKPEVIDLDAVAKVILEQKPDLVALQEVDVKTKRSGPYNQAEELGKRTGLEAHFFRSIDYDGGQYGIAILSRFPVEEIGHYPLPRKEGNGGEPRVLATAQIMLNAKESVLFACTHLDSRRDTVNRRLQAEAIAALLAEQELPVILAGDFNDVPGGPVISILDKQFKRTCDPCPMTFPNDNPARAIDLISFSKGLNIQVKDHRTLPAKYPSDHLPVMAVLEVKY